jgi:hypothetical protein
MRPLLVVAVVVAFEVEVFTARAPLASAAALPALAVTAVWRDAATPIAEGPTARRLIAARLGAEGTLMAERQSGPQQ